MFPSSRLRPNFFCSKLPIVGIKNVAAIREGLKGPAALTAWRKRTGTSRQDLAHLLGLKHSASVYQYETGRLPLTYAHLVNLQKITGISVWTLAWPGQRLVMRQIADADEKPEEAAP